MPGPEDLSPKEAAFDHVGRRQKAVDPATEEETTTCVVCGKDLTDPKNAGDPDENGDWVCTQNHCRAVHEVPMTVERTVIRTQNTGNERHDSDENGVKET